MASFGTNSKINLLTCDQRLQLIAFDAIDIYDFSVICGHRNKKDQEAAFASGNSKAKWGESKHNRSPSYAFDLLPYPSGWNDKEQFYFMAGIIKTVANKRDIMIRWGGDWDNDNDFKDQNFNDLAHFELI